MVLLSHLFRLQMTLQNVLYVSYALPAEAIGTWLPSSFSPSLVAGKAFLSLVVFECKDARPSISPVAFFNYNQLNVRTYVIDPLSGKQAVFFLKSGITSSLVSSLTAAINVPWQHIALNIRASSSTQPPSVSYLAKGEWGNEFLIRANSKAGPLTELPPFENGRAVVDFLIMPSIGYYAHRDRYIRLMTWHPWTQPQRLEPTELDLPFLRQMNILNNSEIEQPHSVLYVRSARFNVSLTPSSNKIA